MPVHDLIHHECDKRMQDLESDMDETKNSLKAVHVALLGDFERPGMKTTLEQTATHVREMRNNNKAWWIWIERAVFGVVIGALVAKAWGKI